MSATSRATSARTSKEQRRLETDHLDRMRQRARRQKQDPFGPDVRSWVGNIKHKKPAPTVLDNRGNAMPIRSANDRWTAMKRRAMRAFLTIWKIFTKRRVMLGKIWESWALRTQVMPFAMTRTLLCYAPAEPHGQGESPSSMNEID